jgi:hypothetical protein
LLLVTRAGRKKRPLKGGARNQIRRCKTRKRATGGHGFRLEDVF